MESMDRRSHYILCYFLNVDMRWLSIDCADEMNEIVIGQGRCEFEFIAEEWPRQSMVACNVLKERNLRITQFAHQSNVTQFVHVSWV